MRASLIPRNMTKRSYKVQPLKSSYCDVNETRGTRIIWSIILTPSSSALTTLHPQFTMLHFTPKWIFTIAWYLFFNLLRQLTVNRRCFNANSYVSFLIPLNFPTNVRNTESFGVSNSICRDCTSSLYLSSRYEAELHLFERNSNGHLRNSSKTWILLIHITNNFIMKGRYKRFNFHNRSEITLIDIDSGTEKDFWKFSLTSTTI